MPWARRRVDRAVGQGGDAGRVVAAVFQAPQAVDQQRCDRRLADDADDAAHACAQLLSFLRCLLCRFFGRAAARGSCAPSPAFSACGPRVSASASAGTSRATTLPAPMMAPSPMRHRRHQRGVGADEGAGADVGVRLEEAVVVAGDGAGADVGAGADAGVADVGQVVDLGALSRRVAFLISTKLPTCAPGPIERPGRSRANGPITAPVVDAARPRDGRSCGSSTPSPMLTPGPKTTNGPTTTSRPSVVS